MQPPAAAANIAHDYEGIASRMLQHDDKERQPREICINEATEEHNSPETFVSLAVYVRLGQSGKAANRGHKMHERVCTRESMKLFTQTRK